MDCPLQKVGKRWERRKEARPQELLAAALDVFVERGFTAARLDDVAARAGVSKGTLYLYFENKEELFKAVVRENVLPIIGEAEEMVDSFEGPTAVLFQGILLGWWERIGSTKLAGITKLMIAESGNFPELANFYYEEVMSRSHAMIIRVLERGIARKEFRAIDAKQAMNVVVAPMVMLMMWNQSFGSCRREKIDPQQYLQCFIDLFLHGLLKDPATPLPPMVNPC